jgi:hypothetical protein
MRQLALQRSIEFEVETADRQAPMLLRRIAAVRVIAQACYLLRTHPASSQQGVVSVCAPLNQCGWPWVACE